MLAVCLMLIESSTALQSIQRVSSGINTGNSNAIPFNPAIYKTGALIRRGRQPQSNDKATTSSNNPININSDDTDTALPAAVLIDFENVRGQTAFESTHRELFQLIQDWTLVCQLQGQVTCIVDHGNAPSAVWIPSSGLSLVFAGPHHKADDVIANDVSLFGYDHDVYLVTADQGLIQRCKRTLIRKNLHIVC
jgi:hypothetical protein